MKRRIFSVLMSAALLLGMTALLAGCAAGPITTADNNGTTIIVTSPAALALVTPLIRNYVEDGGDSVVTVEYLYKPGQDSHSFEPTAKDILALAKADVVVCTGSETWFESSLKASGNTVARVVSMMEACDVTAEDHDHDHDHDQACGLINGDEHVWLSVENAIRIVTAVTGALVEADPDSAHVWKDHAEAYKAELATLSEEYRTMMETAARDTVVIADRHPFVYLFHELGLNCVAAFPGCSSEVSASFETQTKLIETVRSKGITYIFVMEGSDAKVAGVVAGETGAEILTLNSLQIVSDHESVSYVEIMRDNLENLKKALE